eukprot:11273659-Alexandrium_andersonii.AAC.1
MQRKGWKQGRTHKCREQASDLDTARQKGKRDSCATDCEASAGADRSIQPSTSHSNRLTEIH